MKRSVEQTKTAGPSDLYKIDLPQVLVEKQKAKAIKQAKKQLLRERIISESQLAS